MEIEGDQETWQFLVPTFCNALALSTAQVDSGCVVSLLWARNFYKPSTGFLRISGHDAAQDPYRWLGVCCSVSSVG